MRTKHEYARGNAKRQVDAVALVTEVCRTVGRLNWMGEHRRRLRSSGVSHAVRDRDPRVLFDWLMGGLSYQGVSDAAAEGYIAAHGNVTYAAVEEGLRSTSSRCPKLGGFEAFVGCGYRKTAQTCSNPDLLRDCPVPTHDLRRGGLNQMAYSLYFFLREICRDDLGGFIEQVLADADGDDPNRVPRMRRALVGQLTRVHGVSDKVINMMFANLLISAFPRRQRWVEVGISMIAIDTLVHNFLHRTGILRACAGEHPYGSRCYRPGGCAEIVEGLAQQIDCRQLSRGLPAFAPRFVQHCIWAFCAQDQWDICNGNRIDDRRRCRNRDCPTFDDCGRVALRPEPIGSNAKPAGEP